MQTSVLAKPSFAGASVRAAERTQRCSRSAVVVRAEAEGRRAVLSGLLAGVGSLALAKQASAAIELIDDRKAREKGFDIIYEARDVDLPQAQRDGFTQARASVEDTKKRIAESQERIDKKLQTFVDKKYWTLAREELRLQIGTLRFDLNTLSAALPKEERKKAQALSKTFFSKADELDFAIRQKDQDSAQKALAITKSSLDSALSSVL